MGEGTPTAVRDLAAPVDGGAALLAQLVHIIPVDLADQVVLVLSGPVQLHAAWPAENFFELGHLGLCLFGVAAGPHDDRTVEVPAELRCPWGDVADKLPV